MQKQSTTLPDEFSIEVEDDVYLLTPSDMEAARPYTYRVWWSEEDDAYLAAVEELPEVKSHGETESYALEMAHEAAATALWSRRKRGHPIPVATHGQRMSVTDR